MNSLQEDIKIQAEWTVAAFREDGLKLDYSIGSLRILDKFFDNHCHNGEALPDGKLSQNLGYVIFSIGSYLGETIIKNSPDAVWKVDNEDPEGEVNAEIHLIDGGIIWPMQRTMNRFKNGVEDSLFVYGGIITKDRQGCLYYYLLLHLLLLYRDKLKSLGGNSGKPDKFIKHLRNG